MNDNNLRTPEQEVPSRSILQRLGHTLFSPHPSITEVGARRQASLVATIALLISLTNAIGAITLFTVGLPTSGLVLLALTSVSTLGYLLSRTKYYKVGGYTIVWTLALAAFGRTMGADDPSVSLYTQLIPALVIASITFSFRYMLFFTVLSNLAIALLPFALPSYTSAGTDLGVFIPLSVLTLAAMRYRDSVEQDRLADLRNINRELEEVKISLEERVAARTQDLTVANEQLTHRAEQLRLMAEVAKSATTLQELDSALTSITELFSERFGVYHTGIFLLDENREFALLRAANSEGGKRMLHRGHRLQVGEEGIVGFVTDTGRPRIALDVGEDAVYFDNPDLPDTRSEMALPLTIAGQVIGALDLQSIQPNAFSEEDIQILSILADQVAISIQNARLFDETQSALERAELAQRRERGAAWLQQEITGYVYDGLDASPLSEKPRTITTADLKLSVPVQLRGQTIGRIKLNALEPGRSWSDDEVAMVKAAADRVALALENARLLESARRAAEKEQMIGDISAKITSSINMRNVLQTAVEELGQALPGSEVTIQFENQDGQ